MQGLEEILCGASGTQASSSSAAFAFNCESSPSVEKDFGNGIVVFYYHGVDMLGTRESGCLNRALMPIKDLIKRLKGDIHKPMISAPWSDKMSIYRDERGLLPNTE